MSGLITITSEQFGKKCLRNYDYCVKIFEIQMWNAASQQDFHTLDGFSARTDLQLYTPAGDAQLQKSSGEASTWCATRAHTKCVLPAAKVNFDAMMMCFKCKYVRTIILKYA